LPQEFVTPTSQLAEGHIHIEAVVQAFFVAWYNFARKHERLKRRTRAVAGGWRDRVWTIKELIARVAEV
jgi:hypothetical protein